MNVLILSPSFPEEINWFTEGLAVVGARVFGVGEHPKESMHPRTQKALTAYLRVKSLFDEDDVVAEVEAEAKRHGVRFDRIECLWEPFMILAARLRERLGASGMSVADTVPFRDKEIMKQKLDEAGIRTPRHARCMNAAECREAAERIGFPIIIKPIAGAGSADTYRCNDHEDFERALALTQHVREVSVEEFIDGEEFTFDTVCASGRVEFMNVCWYRPRPLIARQVQWISPQTMALRDIRMAKIQPGIEMGLRVLKALGFEYGFTHMEWYLKENGEAVFGEIGARPPGAHTVDILNFASDIDLYRHWAEAVCQGKTSLKLERKYNCAHVCKRAQGEGRIQRIVGLESLMRRYGQWIPHVDLLPVGAHRRNWKQTLLSDGYLILRHPDLGKACEIADAIGTDLQLYAG